jgi:hypothetical protein
MERLASIMVTNSRPRARPAGVVRRSSKPTGELFRLAMISSAVNRDCLVMVIAFTLALPLSVRTMQPGATGRDMAAWVLFVDDLHVEFANTGRVRAFIQNVASDVIRATDTVAIRTSGPSGVASRMGSRGGLIQAIRELYGAGLKPGDLRGDRIAEETDLRARLSLSSARAAVELLAETEPPLRGLIYISNGPWQHLAGDTQALVSCG